MSRGLEARADWFWINGKKTRLFSGAMHYFRIPREYWKDRLVKLRSSGCNVLETYVPWNLHEPTRGVYDFEEMLDLRAYIKLAEECGLYVIVRPGPYICSEWDLGGLPAWLLRDSEMKLRTNYEPYMEAVKVYFKELLPRLTDLQYSSGGGSIIAWQIENEYGTFCRDVDHLIQLQKLMVECGCTELMFTSDNEQGILNEPLEGVLMMANFQDIKLGKEMLEVLKDKQPGMPRMCMEFWSGWFDHWGDKSHQVWPLGVYKEALQYILEKYGSVNFYMFHGGTNFGFMNGANEQTENDQLKNGQDYLADVTSYDYDALLTEQGTKTDKYHRTAEMLSKYADEVIYLSACPQCAPVSPPTTYGEVTLDKSLSMESVLQLSTSCEVKGQGMPMEMLAVNKEQGQLYGWTLYRRNVDSGGTVIIGGQVRDRTQVFISGELVTTFDCNTPDFEFTLPSAGVLDLLIENMGRSNYQPMDKNVLNAQRKGLDNKVTLNGDDLCDWTVYCLDFGKDFLASLESAEFSNNSLENTTPVLLRGNFEVTTPIDSFLDMNGWGKGIVLVNGRNLGRYWPTKGPTKTMYVPGPWLKQGNNEIIIFELEKALTKLAFTDTPQLG